MSRAQSSWASKLLQNSREALRGVARRLFASESFPAGYPGYVLTDLDVHGVRGLMAMARAFLSQQARRRGGDAGTDLSRTRILQLARVLEQYNPYAQGILSGLGAYVIGSKGMTVEAVARPGYHESLRAEAQWYLDAFRDHEDWWSREREVFNRAHRDGEGILRFYSHEDYTLPCGVQVRPMEPEFITPPDGSDEWTHGLRNKPGDVETIEAVNYQYRTGEYEEVPASEVYMIKLNVDRCIKRGRSDFTSTAPILEDAIRLVQNMTQAEGIRQGILYFTQHPDSSDSDIQQLIASQTDYTPPAGSPGSPHGQFPTQIVHGVGEVHLTGNQVLAKAPGSENIPAAVAGLNAALLAVGRRHQMPLWLIAGDASRNNAIDLEGEDPFCHVIELEQYLFSRHCRNIMWRVLAIGVDRGDLPAEVLSAVDVIVKPQKTFGSRDPNKETDRRAKLYEAGLLSKRSWSAEEGLDFENQQAERSQEHASNSVPQAGSPGATNGQPHFAN